MSSVFWTLASLYVHITLFTLIEKAGLLLFMLKKDEDVPKGWAMKMVGDCCPRSVWARIAIVCHGGKVLLVDGLWILSYGNSPKRNTLRQWMHWSGWIPIGTGNGEDSSCSCGLEGDANEDYHGRLCFLGHQEPFLDDSERGEWGSMKSVKRGGREGDRLTMKKRGRCDS
jgi:hypothetical protein